MRYLAVFIAMLAPLALSPDASAQESGGETKWETVERFEGQGQTNTRPFRIQADMWAVVYDSRSTMGGGAGHIFQVYLQKPGDDLYNEILANVVNEKRIQGDSYVYDQGTFYMQVNAANGKWAIEVKVPKDK